MTKLRALVRRRWTVLLAGALLGAIAGGLSAAIAPVDESVESYRVSQLIVANRGTQSGVNVEQDALRVTRGTVAEHAAEQLGVSDLLAEAAKVSAVADTDSSSIEVASKDRDRNVARERVDAYVSAFLAVVNADLLADQEKRFTELQEQIGAAEAALEAFDQANPGVATLGGNTLLAQQRAQLDDGVRSARDQLATERLNARATLPYSTLGPDAPVRVDSDLLPVPSGVPFRVALLSLVGLALAASVVIVVERLVPRIDTRDELVAAVDLPVLAEVGYFSSRKIPRAPDGTLRLDGAWAEPYRRIRSAVQFLQVGSSGADGGARVFMFTSPSPSEGKSTTTAVTALALAEAGQRTLVVGGDFRRPSVHTLLGVPATPGIREHARLDIDRPSSNQIVHPTHHPHLYVAPSGAPAKEVAGLAEAARSLITDAVAQGATVVIDTSPVEVANDAIDLLPVVDHVILVVRSGRTTRRALNHTIEQLEMHGASVMGTTLIGTPGLAKQQYYYEGYYAEPSSGRPDDTDFFSTDEPRRSSTPRPGDAAKHGSQSSVGYVGTWATAPAGGARERRTAPPPYRGRADRAE